MHYVAMFRVEVDIQQSTIGTRRTAAQLDLFSHILYCPQDVE